MKKFFILIFLSFFSFSALFSQNSKTSYASDANRTTAIRCLKLAESCLVGKDYVNARNQAELGLSYDDSISDLFYVQAAASMNLNDTKASVLEILSKAFERNSWIDYTENGARILYADLLSDRGDYEKSLSILDADPFIYSADAEFIRVKNYYRMGGEEAVSTARNKINAARRIYAGDIRFMQCFFYFETSFILSAMTRPEPYVIPEISSVIAEAYILHLPDYSGHNLELELMASFFAKGESQARLIRAIDAKNMSVQPLLAIAALYEGLYSQQQAFDLFFETSGNTIPLIQLEAFASLIKDDEIRFQLAEKLANFEGRILVDGDRDLQNELSVDFKNGRPLSFSYSRHNDGITDVSGLCDLGSPSDVTVNYGKSQFEVKYYEFPEVSEISSEKGEKSEINFKFLRKSFDLALLQMKKNELLAGLSVDFYIPEIPSGYEYPSVDSIRQACNKMRFAVSERDDAFVVYNMYEGQPVDATFFAAEQAYARCSFSEGLPFIRYADYDGDKWFETQEIYDGFNPETARIPEQNKNMIADVFSPIAGGQNLYLKKVSIDRNKNRFFEFSEEYFENGDVQTVWDNNDDGLADCLFIKYAKNDGEAEKDLTVYYDAKGREIISMTCLDNVPVKLVENQNQELIVYAGRFDDVFWIENQGDEELESELLTKVGQEFGSKLTQGKTFILQTENVRVKAIEVGSKLFFRIIPE